MDVAEGSTSLNFDDIIPSTPDNEIKVKKSKKTSRKRYKNWRCEKEIIPSVRTQSFKELKKSGDCFKSQMYVFHSFNSVLKYKPKSKPLNSYIKIIGYYKTSRTCIPYIRGYDVSDENFAIFVAFETLESAPLINDVVEIFGHLEFRAVANHNMPIIIVHFWIKLDDNISSYIQCLKMQMAFISNTIEIEVESKNEESDSLVELLRDISFGIISIEEN